MPRILIIIPAYNEESSIGEVIDGLRQFAPTMDRVIVDDGSIDGTRVVVGGLGEKQLKLSSNLGYGTALQTGMKYALARGHDIIVTMDADGQHRPEDVPYLVQSLIDNDVDIVIGARFSKDRAYDTPIFRRLGQVLFSHLTQLLVGQRIYDTSSGFKVMRAQVCEILEGATFMDFHIETIVRLSMLGYKIQEVPVKVLERNTGRSMHSYTSVFQYPLRTLLLIVVAAVDALLERRIR